MFFSLLALIPGHSSRAEVSRAVFGVRPVWGLALLSRRFGSVVSRVLLARPRLFRSTL